MASTWWPCRPRGAGRGLARSAGRNAGCLPAAACRCRPHRRGPAADGERCASARCRLLLAASRRGGGAYSQALADAIERANAANVLFVGAPAASTAHPEGWPRAGHAQRHTQRPPTRLRPSATHSPTHVAPTLPQPPLEMTPRATPLCLATLRPAHRLLPHATLPPPFHAAAAGNDFKDNDALPYYPASYPSPNIISVAALTSAGALRRARAGAWLQLLELPLPCCCPRACCHGRRLRVLPHLARLPHPNHTAAPAVTRPFCSSCSSRGAATPRL